jgi:chromosome segregation ATPase
LWAAFYHEGMEEKSLRDAIKRLDAQMPLVRAELSKVYTKADKIDADQRKTMALFEETDGKFKLTLEAYISIGGRMDLLEARMDKLEARMDKLETEMKEGFELVLRKLDELLGGKLAAKPAV